MVRFITRCTALIAAVLLIALGISPLTATETPLTHQEAYPATVSVQTANLSPVDDVLHAFGRVQPARLVHVPMPDQRATLSEILVQAGQSVRRGQVLARLDPEGARRDLALAEANLQAADAELSGATDRLELAEALIVQRSRELARLTLLVEKQAASVVMQEDAQRALETARLNQRIAVSALSSARAAAQVARLEVERSTSALNHTRIVAPESGLLLSVDAQAGEVPQIGKPLFSLAVEGEMEAVLDLTSLAMTRVQAGDPVTVRLAGAVTVDGVVTSVGTAVGTGAIGAAKVRLDDDPNLIAGSSLHAEIVTDRRMAVIVPVSAIVPLPSGPGIVQVIESRAVATPVRLSGSASGVQAEVIEGLDVGARYVAQAGQLVPAGAMLKPVEPGQGHVDVHAANLAGGGVDK